MSTYCKYYKEKKQVSYDNGITYVDVVPAEYRKGELIEIGSADCVIAPSGYSTHFLTLVPLENGEFNFEIRYTDYYVYIYYSLNSGATWNTLTLSSASTTSIQATSGNKIMLKGNGYVGDILRITSTCNYNIEGNILSLDYGDNFTGQTSVPSPTNNHTHRYLFSGSTQLKSAENLILPYYFASDSDYYGYAEGMFMGCTSLTTAPLTLPATILVPNCYRLMFRGCTSLTTAPALPATSVAVNCYEGMFNSCTSLTTAPDLPATSVEEMCYYSMFNGCTSLTTAPVLSAATLAKSCYGYMFYGCTSLNYVKCLATNISAEQCTDYWLNNVSATGTFVKASSMSGWATGADGIPSNWSVQNA